MPRVKSDGLPSLQHGSLFLEARRLERSLSSDLVLHWSTQLTPYEFLLRCEAFKYAPDFIRRVEIIADDDLVSFESIAQLREDLQGRHLVRFNFKDWTVTWLAPFGDDAAEIQALLGDEPAAMAEMVKQSVHGFVDSEVKDFFEQLHRAA